ncbi:hypothetical protein H9Y04_14510 [Streptomyces sp. TRM66268-LWL]|uniref:Glycosyltransferase RgtA/B/C/D-like domain-containing protein n=1 Tax=Streptomyces polyasparticus TaxID=2767826 RepID=A0ABR7SE54_9ACTN|nr:hypothetical protein [Streptomyces polyasparticus]MBC9713780.1 hypothetical protein [Streptomyces polyasparticus]
MSFPSRLRLVDFARLRLAHFPRLRLAGAAMPVLAFLLGMWGSTGPSPWTDEIVTMDVARRSWPELFGLLGRVDAVHGLHYALMHMVGQVTSVTAFTMRVPSAAAVAVAVAGTVWLGRSLGGPRSGVCAGLALAVAPTASRYAQEGRSFAFVMAAAVLATGALVKVLNEQDVRRRSLLAYASAVAVLGWLNVLGLLLLAAHALTVAWLRPGRRTALRVAGAQVAGLVTVAPLLIIGATQHSAVGEAPPVSAGTPLGFLSWLLSPGQDTLLPWMKLVLLGSVLTALTALAVRRRTAPPLLHAVALPWLVVPPLCLALAAVLQPVFAYRYLLFCLPALVLLLAGGLFALHWTARTALVLAMAVPLAFAHRAIRLEPSRAWDTAAAVRILHDHGAPGDAVVFTGARCGLISTAYEEAFAGLPDAGRARTAAETDALDDEPVPPAVLARRLERASRVWHVACTHVSEAARPAAERADAQTEQEIRAAGLKPSRHFRTRGIELTLETR